MRILLIDDNQQITKMLTKVLEIEGHECIVFNEGQKGLDAIEKTKFDAVLLDLAMPNFSGFDVVDALEKKDKLAQNNIIIFTAASIPQSTLDDFVKRGVYTYLTKPVDIDVLLEKLKTIQN